MQSSPQIIIPTLTSPYPLCLTCLTPLRSLQQAATVILPKFEGNLDIKELPAIFQELRLKQVDERIQIFPLKFICFQCINQFF
jgi:hypothetical protein